MMSGRNRFLDIESSNADTFIFVGSFVGGAAWILISRLFFDAPAVIAVVAPVAIMVLYAKLMLNGVFRLREDRAADNLYYLGFLFTLVSLGVGLYRYDSQLGGVDNIIKDLGVGLTTTIVGLFLRILFLQLRVDVDNASEDAKLELSNAIEGFRLHVHEMGQVSNESRALIQQQYAESAEEIAGAADEIKSSIKGLSRSITNLDKRIEAIDMPKDIFSSMFYSFGNEVQNSVTALTTQVEVAGNGLEGLAKRFEQAGETLSEKLNNFNESLFSSKVDTEVLIAPLQEGISEAVKEFYSLAASLGPLTESLEKSNKSYSSGVQQFENSVEKWSMIVGEGSPLSIAAIGLGQNIESYDLLFKAVDSLPSRLESILGETLKSHETVEGITTSLRVSIASLNDNIHQVSRSTEQLNTEIKSITEQFESTIESLLKAAS
jgi:methyl-accepting chemotaxis protein